MTEQNNPSGAEFNGLTFGLSFENEVDRQQALRDLYKDQLPEVGAREEAARNIYRNPRRIGATAIDEDIEPHIIRGEE